MKSKISERGNICKWVLWTLKLGLSRITSQSREIFGDYEPRCTIWQKRFNFVMGRKKIVQSLKTY